MSKTLIGGGGSWDDVETQYGIAPARGPANGPGDVHWEFPDFVGRVHKGMDLLDEVAHGWPDEIDVSILDLDDGSTCVLGQTWPHYARLLGMVSAAVTDIRILGRPTAFDQMSSQLIPGSSHEERINFAASIGCALSTEDLENFNAMTKAYVIYKLGSATASTTPGYQMMTETSIGLQKRAFELLTETWLLEIARARAAGRWNQELILPETRGWFFTDTADAVNAAETADQPRELLHV